MKTCRYYSVVLFLWLYFVSCVLGQYVGNPDDTAKIERPCPTYDLNCIRAFFQKHAHCKKTFGPVPDPINRPEANNYVPRVNFSVTIIDEKINGLNGRVEEFYINRDTDNLVISVEFRNITQTSDGIHFIIHRRAKEPIITVTSGTVSYASLLITAVIPNVNNLQLQDAEYTTFSNDPTGRVALAPTAAASDDPQVQEGIAAFLANLRTFKSSSLSILHISSEPISSIIYAILDCC